jgi:hypothetical protein
MEKKLNYNVIDLIELLEYYNFVVDFVFNRDCLIGLRTYIAYFYI